jgi:hypothetical protein
MRPQSASRQRAVSQIAEKQHGVAGCHELYEVGLSPSAVKRWTADGRLHRALADCGETMPTRVVVRLLEQAERLGLFDLAALRERPALAPALAQVLRIRPKEVSHAPAGGLSGAAVHGARRQAGATAHRGSRGAMMR